MPTLITFLFIWYPDRRTGRKWAYIRSPLFLFWGLFQKERGPVDRTARIREIAEKIATSEGMELVDLDFRREGSGRVVRLFIDKPGGVNLTDCQEISGQVGAQLEVEDLVPESYTLEVSSPGLDRRLTRETDFVQFSGRKARVTTHQPIQGRRKFLGNIEGFVDGKIVLSTEDSGTVEIPLEDVARARLEVEL